MTNTTMTTGQFDVQATRGTTTSYLFGASRESAWAWIQAGGFDAVTVTRGGVVVWQRAAVVAPVAAVVPASAPAPVVAAVPACPPASVPAGLPHVVTATLHVPGTVEDQQEAYSQVCAALAAHHGHPVPSRTQQRATHLQIWLDLPLPVAAYGSLLLGWQLVAAPGTPTRAMGLRGQDFVSTCRAERSDYMARLAEQRRARTG